MGGCMGQWVGSGQMTNLIKLELINIIWFCLKIYNLSRHPYLWVDGWVNGWAHVKPLKSNKSWPNRDNSIMDILDILWDILLKPPQPFIGLFFFCATWGPVWWRSRNGSVTLTYCHMSRWCPIVFYFWHHKQWGCFDHFLLCYQWFWHWGNWHLKWDCEQGIYVGWK